MMTFVKVKWRESRIAKAAIVFLGSGIVYMLGVVILVFLKDRGVITGEFGEELLLDALSGLGIYVLLLASVITFAHIRYDFAD